MLSGLADPGQAPEVLRVREQIRCWRLDDHARVEVADLEQPLDIVPDACIDLVVASLVLHYIEDWRPLLGELHRDRSVGGMTGHRSGGQRYTGGQCSGKRPLHASCRSAGRP
jgi:hypothetical protein